MLKLKFFNQTWLDTKTVERPQEYPPVGPILPENNSKGSNDVTVDEISNVSPFELPSLATNCVNDLESEIVVTEEVAPVHSTEQERPSSTSGTIARLLKGNSTPLTPGNPRQT